MQLSRQPSILLAMMLAAIGGHAASADEVKNDRMAEIIAALRAEEAKYRDLEYALRITTRTANPNDPTEPENVTSETRHVVLQGDRVWFRGETFARFVDMKRRHEEISAYDGDRTRTVVAGNSVNIHLGRFEHPDVYPAHCVPLFHYRINFPLSVYLAGTEAIHAHPKYGRFLRERGTVYEIAKLVARLEGEEMVDGLRCVKIRCDRWTRSKGKPVTQDFWLTPERNYLCVKTDDMRVDELREIAPGVWFPVKVTQGDRSVTIVESVRLDPRPDPALFHDVAIPADLPLFTLRGEALVGSALPEPLGGHEEQAKLDEVVARVRAEEKRYADIEVKAQEHYRHLSPKDRGEFSHRDETRAVHMHTVLREPLAYFASRAIYTTNGGVQTDQFETEAFDGTWTRTFHATEQAGAPIARSAWLRKGGRGKAEGRLDGTPVLRPHTLLVRDDWIYGPLADLLVSPWHDKINKDRLRFRYCGEEEVDGHPCVKLRAEVTTGEGHTPFNYMAFWLATDRNWIPIKLEHYGGNSGLRPIPTGIHLALDFREVAPGIWFPFRSTQIAFDNWVDIAFGRITVNWRRDYAIESVTLAPTINAALFHDVVVTAGTEVYLIDQDPEIKGKFVQEKDGVPESPPAP